MKRASAFFLFAALFVIVGLAQNRPKAGDQTATVIFYRLTEGSVWESKKTKIKIDGREVATLQKGTHHTVELPAGKHLFRMQQGHTEIELDCEAGKTYYIQAAQTVAGFFYNQTLTLVSAEQAEGQVKKTKPLEKKHTKP